jgi:hypothetical protein
MIKNKMTETHGETSCNMLNIDIIHALSAFLNA